MDQKPLIQETTPLEQQADLLAQQPVDPVIQPLQPQVTPQTTEPPISPAVPQAPTLAPTSTSSAEETPEQEVEHTLDLLHRHERPLAIGMALIILLFSIANVLVSTHILAVRNHTYNNLTWVRAQKARASFGAALVNRPDNTLDMSHTFQDTYTTANQDIQAGLHQQVNLANGLSFIITDVQTNFKPGGHNFQPFAGDQYIKIGMVIGNRSLKSQDFPFAGLNAVLPSGKVIDSPISDPPDVANAFGSGVEDLASDFTQLDSKETRSGNIMLEVPANTLPKLRYEVSSLEFVQGDSDSTALKDVTMKATVTLQ